MVKRILPLFLALTFALSLTVFGVENLRIEQIQGEMPNLDLYFYAEGAPSEATLDFMGKTLEATALTGVSNSTTHHFFLVDCSTSTTYAQIEGVKGALADFTAQKSPTDTVTLIPFGTEVTILLEGETQEAVIYEAIDSLKADQPATLFFDSIALASALAEDLPPMERCVLYVFSDAGDYNLGGYTQEEVQSLLLDGGLPLYAFGFDSGSKDDLDRFGALARGVGGEISIVSGQTVGTMLKATVEQLSSAYVAHFTTSSNHLPDPGAVATLTVDRVSGSIATHITAYLKDDVAPTLVSLTQLENNNLVLTFSEPVLGADRSGNYIVKDGGGGILPLSGVVYEEDSATATLTLASLPSQGTLTLSTTGITDDSQDKNLVETTVTVAFTLPETRVEEAQPTPTTPVVEEEERQGAPLVAYVALVIIALAIATGMILASMKKKKRTEEVAQAPTFPPTPPTQTAPIYGETGKAHFQGGNLLSKTVVLSVTNVSGKTSRVKLSMTKTMFVGRSEICDVVFDDISMSRQHFVLEDVGHDFTITNLSNGPLLLNGVQVQNPRPIHGGDVIEAGAQRIIFSVEG